MKMICKKSIVAAVLAVTMTSGAAMACDAPAGAGELRQGVVRWINEVRRDRGLSALRVSETLQASATKHACDMARRSYFAHQGPGGPSFARRLKSVGYNFSTANENIARTHKASVSSAATVWRESPPHWANLMNPNVREVGVGVAAGGGRTYWVMNAGSE